MSKMTTEQIQEVLDNSVNLGADEILELLGHCTDQQQRIMLNELLNFTVKEQLINDAVNAVS